MLADDPRHGTYAGALQHWRAGEKACEPCKAGARRADKLRDLAHMQGRPPMVPLGERAHRIVVSSPRNQLHAATGITSHRLLELERKGPTRLVRRTTRDRILAFQLQWTPVGIQRRLQALSWLGYSMKTLATETGLNLGSLCRLRRNPDVKFVRHTTAAAILDVWDQLHMTPAPDGHSSRETKAEAVRRGWLPPLAFDDIDDPAEKPRVTSVRRSRCDVDEVAVLRLLNGERLECTKAEKAEVTRRWLARGWPLAELERQQGWRSGRYGKAGEQVAS